jgi:hypothetical protein
MSRAKAAPQLEGPNPSAAATSPAAPRQLPVRAPIEEEVAIPIPDAVRRSRKASTPKGSRRGRIPPIEELLSPIPRTRPQERQQCLALLMQTTGHSLDWGCRLCTSKCVYAIPCGCGGWDCIDRKSREPLVVFTETAKASRRQRRREAKALRKAMGRPAQPPLLVRILMPWTWFRKKPAR